MGAKISKRYSSYNSQPKVFKLLLIFLPNVLKTTLGIFKILKIEILMIFFFVFVNMGPYGSQNFKVLLLLQIGFDSIPHFFCLFFFSTKLSRKFPVTVSQKLLISISKFQFFFKYWNLTLWPVGNEKLPIFWKWADVGQNSEILASGWVFSVYMVLLTAKCLRSLWGY